MAHVVASDENLTQVAAEAAIHLKYIECVDVVFD